MARPRAVQRHVPTISPELARTRLQRLLDGLSEVRAAKHNSPIIGTWRGNVRVTLDSFYGPDSIQVRQFQPIDFSPGVYYPGQPTAEFVEAQMKDADLAEGFLRSRVAELTEEIEQQQSKPGTLSQVNSSAALPAKDNHKVFVVHGHDHGSKETVARYLSRLGLEPVILHEKADQGRTIIEKFELHADVPCAVVILSADDVGYSKQNQSLQEDRARQNVIFEMGFFFGSLGRKHTFALLQKGVTRPSDTDGILYIPMDDDSAWKMRLVGELKAAGMAVDANKAFD